MSTHHHLEAFLQAFDVPNRPVPANAVRVFLAVAQGCDHVSDIASQLGIPARTAARLVKLLAGRDRYVEGSWIESPFSYVTLRPHPHRQGEQVRLSQQGQQVFDRLGTPGKSE